MTAHLRRREDGALELRVNGVFVMDDVETSSERVLAEVVLDAGAREVLIGGLGLGHTLRALLDGGATGVLVAEIEPEIVTWMRTGRIRGRELLDDPRTEIVVGDVRDVVEAQPPARWDAICLDVDNGPDFLVHEHNADIYSDDFLGACRTALRPDGALAIWSMNRPAGLLDALRERFDRVDEHPVPVRLQDRPETYWVLLAR